MPIEVGPDWYIYGMHFSAMITTPVNIFGVYVILFCQTKQLASYRWHLLVFQVIKMQFYINFSLYKLILIGLLDDIRFFAQHWHASSDLFTVSNGSYSWDFHADI